MLRLRRRAERSSGLVAGNDFPRVRLAGVVGGLRAPALARDASVRRSTRTSRSFLVALGQVVTLPPIVDFDAITIEQLRRRRGKKWREFGDEVIPAWVADMDFPVAEPIRRYLTEAVMSSDFGYPSDGSLPRVFADRARRRYDWHISPDQVETIVDVVQGLYLAVQAYAEEGEGVVIQTPIYPPFLNAVADSRRRAVLNPLTWTHGRVGVDLDGLRRAIGDGARLLLLCNPHNPSGRVFRRDELERIAEMVLASDVVVVADEIHADVVYEGHRHIAFASLSPEVAARTVTFNSATKAFNTAGLRCAVAVFGTAELKKRFNFLPVRVRGGFSSFGPDVTRVAWEECDDWRGALVKYLRANRDFIAEFLRAELPPIGYVPPEATYLAWLDCRRLGLKVEPHEFFLEHARVALSPGPAFGEEGAGFVRLNFATSRAILRELLERMTDAVRRHA